MVRINLSLSLFVVEIVLTRGKGEQIIQQHQSKGLFERRFRMNRSLVSILTIACTFVLFNFTPAAAQGRGAQPKKDAPKVGAWWYTGSTPPPMLDGHPDMTGVWFSGSSADLSKETIP